MKDLIEKVRGAMEQYAVTTPAKKWSPNGEAKAAIIATLEGVKDRCMKAQYNSFDRVEDHIDQIIKEVEDAV